MEYGCICMSIQSHFILTSLQTAMSKYQGRVDPIELLRSVYADGKSLKYKDRHLQFEKGVRLPLTHPTAWVATHSRKNYSLGSLWLYLEHVLKHTHDYIQRVTYYGLDAVTVSDRRQIEDYFTGRVNATSCIDQQLWLQHSSKGQIKPNYDEDEPKRKTQTMSSELVVIDYISKFQRPISSKTRSLRCPNKSLQSLLKVCHVSTATLKDKITRSKQLQQNKKVPIIIVPEQQLAGNISLANIQRLLVFGEYISSPQKLPQHQRKCEITMNFGGKKMLFEVNSNPKLMPAKDWPNVVAIFLQGIKNEFEGWPCSDPTIIFKQARVFLLKFPGNEEHSPESGVKELILDRNLRYRDSLVQRQILTGIEEVLGETV